ncbi:MAG: response regulator [Pseudomonadota bacterium]|nr:response regulator [Pseudomonadota bacterium]
MQNHSAARATPAAAVAGHVLVVEDDAAMREMILEYLADRGLPAASASGPAEARRAIGSGEPGLVLLDLQLGQADGLDLLREIRAVSDVPVIIITGHRREEIDRVVGLELGADDYLAKPFGLRELTARIRAILRRQEIGRALRARDPERGGYRFAGWRLERRARRLTDPEGRATPLTKGEYALLLAFLAAPGRVLSREQLLHATRMHEDVFDRSIDVQVLRLRRKLEADPSAPALIRTERGVGYVFAVEAEAW